MTRKSDGFMASGLSLTAAAGGRMMLDAPHRPAWRDVLEGLAIGALIFLLLILGGLIVIYSL